MNVPSTHTRPARPATAGEIDGLIIGGGADVPPELYGHPIQASLSSAQSSVSRRVVEER